jgi:hypothetical protein
MKPNTQLKVIASIGCVLCLVSHPRAAAPAQSCTKCDVTTTITYPNSPPSCYMGTTITLQAVQDGECSSGCSPTNNCEYNLSIQMNANTGQVCDMAIFLPHDPTTCSTSQGPGCSSCSSLNWSHTTDPEEVECHASQDRFECYEMRACNPVPPPACTFVGSVVAKLEIKCFKCSP